MRLLELFWRRGLVLMAVRHRVPGDLFSVMFCGIWRCLWLSDNYER